MNATNQILESTDKEVLTDQQLDYIRQLLVKMRDSIVQEKQETLPLKAERLSDIADCAHQEEQWMIAIRKRSHETDLLGSIDKALHKVETGRYGYCEFSGEPIAIRRLLANPTSCTTLEEQIRRERQKEV